MLATDHDAKRPGYEGRRTITGETLPPLTSRVNGKLDPMCWHRPGRSTASGTVLCHHCSVAIEWCPCVDREGSAYRKYDPHCPACHGSMWVSIVRSARAKFDELLARMA